MSGHSHWSTIRRQKQTEDNKRSKLFAKLSSAISTAVKENKGATDPNTNPRLRLAIEHAQRANMSKENVQRAMQKGIKGGDKGEGVEVVPFGGFILGDTALFIEATTANRRRTTAQIKNILEARGGKIVPLESIKPFFKRIGVITILREKRTEDECIELALKLGADDVKLSDTDLQLMTNPHAFSAIKKNLAKEGITITSANLELRPKTPPISQKEDHELLNQVVKQLREHEDITQVYHVRISPSATIGD